MTTTTDTFDAVLETPDVSSAGLPTVLFIGGHGRSGSTVLGRILGQIEGWCFVGELHAVWRDGFVKSGLCECGKALPHCPFWSAVADKAFGTTDREFFRCIANLKHRVARMRHYHRLLHPWLALSQYREDLVRYERLLRKWYSAIAYVSGCSVVVDTSKIPSHGLILRRALCDRMYCMHLVRDPRACVFSWQRKKQKPDGSLMPTHTWGQVVREWIKRNVVADRLDRHCASHIVRYERFADVPLTVCQEIVEAVGDDTEKAEFIGKEEIRLTRSHSVRGNPDGVKTSIRIKSDDQWRQDLPVDQRRKITVFTWPWLRKYGYE